MYHFPNRLDDHKKGRKKEMGKKFNKFVAFALAAAMMIPMCGIGAKAETKETEISLAERLTIRAIQKAKMEATMRICGQEKQ